MEFRRLVNALIERYPTDQYAVVTRCIYPVQQSEI